MVKVSKITHDTLNRFPCKYKILAFKALDYEVRDGMGITMDTAISAALLYFAERGRVDEIPAFIEHMQKTIDTGADYYEDAVAEGLCNRLRNEFEIEYRRK